MGNTTSFDATHAKSYLFAMFVILLAQVVVVVRTIVGNPPAWSADHDLTVMLFSLAGVWTLVAMRGLKKTSARPIYWLCSSSVMFSVTAFTSGYSLRVCLLVGISGLMVWIMAWLTGDKGDVNLPGRTIRVRLPWL